MRQPGRRQRRARVGAAAGHVCSHQGWGEIHRPAAVQLLQRDGDRSTSRLVACIIFQMS